MKGLLVALIVCFSASTFAEDLGKIGPTFTIQEDDLEQVFIGRAKTSVANGAWSKAMTAETGKMRDYAARPIGRQLPRAPTYSVEYWDPSVTLDNDITDQKGQVLFPRGTRVNPLEYRDYTKALCFFDGDDAEQVAWISDHCADFNIATMIMVSGSLKDVTKQLHKRIFYDQYGYMTKRMAIKHLPALVRQTGKLFAVEYFPVGQ